MMFKSNQMFVFVLIFNFLIIPISLLSGTFFSYEVVHSKWIFLFKYNPLKNNKKHFEYIKSYSPYHNIKKMNYPNLLLVTNLKDVRVIFDEPTKFTAKLRQYKTDKNLLLLKCELDDAGHGGKDPGSIGNNSYEKNITLSISLELGRIIKENLPGIKIIYTRKDDSFPSLYERAEIANKNQSILVTTKKDFVRIPKSYRSLVNTLDGEIEFEDEKLVFEILSNVIENKINSSV